jgi:hypothetical protein
MEKTDTSATLADFLQEGQMPGFSDSLTALPAEYGRLIAELMSAYALIDVGQQGFFATLFGPQAAIGAFMYHEMVADGSSVRKMMRAAAKARMSEEQHDYFRALAQFTGATPRNDMAHGMWAYSEIVGDRGVLLVPPEDWMAIYGAALAGARTATFNPARIRVYDQAILQRLIDHVKVINDAWFMLATWVDPKVAPIQHERPDEKLRAITPLAKIAEGIALSRRSKPERDERGQRNAAAKGDAKSITNG